MNGSNAGPSERSRLEFGIAHLQAGRSADAETCFRQVLEKSPTDSDAMHLLGVIALGAQRHAEGIDLIRQAIQHNPGNPEYHSNLGATYWNLGHPQEALGSYN